MTPPSCPPADNLADILVEAVDNIDALIAYWDSDQVCRFANQAYQRWFGRDRQALLGMTLKELLGPLYALNLPHIEAAYRGERQVFERAIPGAGGVVRNSLATYTPRVVDGQVVGIFVHVADVDLLKRMEVELRAAKEQAEHVAMHDFLTGLPNRVTLNARIEEAIARSKRTGVAVCLLTLDIDNFKTVNDTFGHAEGDRFLVEIASRIRSCVRAYDTAARLGGDEFVLLVSELASVAEIRAFADRVLETIRQPCAIAGTSVIPGASIGIAAYAGQGETAAALLAASDKALYAAKDAGRDRYAIAGGEPG